MRPSKVKDFGLIIVKSFNAEQGRRQLTMIKTVSRLPRRHYSRMMVTCPSLSAISSFRACRSMEYLIKTVCVVGFAYIVPPTAATLASRGTEVIGVDTDPRVVEACQSA
jgi:hypothetical protein